MPDSRPDDRFALRALTKEQRRLLVRHANRGEQHPDPEVAAAAYRWSHGAQWKRMSNRLPGWMLTTVALLLALAFVGAGLAGAAPLPAVVFLVAACLVVGVMGILGWMSTSIARTLREVYPTAPTTD